MKIQHLEVLVPIVLVAVKILVQVRGKEGVLDVVEVVTHVQATAQVDALADVLPHALLDAVTHALTRVAVLARGHAKEHVLALAVVDVKIGVVTIVQHIVKAPVQMVAHSVATVTV